MSLVEEHFSETSIVVEEYLQLIYRLHEAGERVKAVKLANRLKTSPSTVHATLSRMQRDDLIEIGKKKEILLTPAGEEKARDMSLRHNLAENFLCNVLGIPWYEVHKHAHRLEHAMTPLVVEKLAEFLGQPEYCPHGTPISGSPNDLPDNHFPLDEVQTGMEIEVIMIDESLEDSEELLKFLHDHNLIPGQRHTIEDRIDVTQSLSLLSETGQTNLPFDIAKKIFVTEISTS